MILILIAFFIYNFALDCELV